MTGTPESAAGEPVPVTPTSAPGSAVSPSELPVLPEQTKDDLDEDYRDRPQDDDDRFTRERPPHW